MNRYKIGEISKIKNVDKQTLRYYDKIGLLKPNIIDEENGYRYYTMDQFIEVDGIKFCKLMGFSLDDIKSFNDVESVDETLDIFKKKQMEFEREVLQKQALLKEIKNKISKIEDKKKEYEEIGSKIRIEHIDDFYGVCGEARTANDWYDFEAKLLEITKKYPNYSQVGHNSELRFIYSEEYLHADVKEREEVKYMNKIILPIDESYKDEDNVEKIHMGKCLVMLIGSSRWIDNSWMAKINEFISKNKMKIRGDIITSSIIDFFIVRNVNEALYEVKIPLME